MSDWVVLHSLGVLQASLGVVLVGLLWAAYRLRQGRKRVIYYEERSYVDEDQLNRIWNKYNG